MSNDRVRQCLSYFIIGTFLFIETLILITMIIGYMDMVAGIELIKSIFSIFSGLIGVIIGYYFSKK